MTVDLGPIQIRKVLSPVTLEAVIVHFFEDHSLSIMPAGDGKFILADEREKETIAIVSTYDDAVRVAKAHLKANATGVSDRPGESPDVLNLLRGICRDIALGLSRDQFSKRCRSLASLGISVPALPLMRSLIPVLAPTVSSTGKFEKTVVRLPGGEISFDAKLKADIAAALLVGLTIQQGKSTCLHSALAPSHLVQLFVIHFETVCRFVTHDSEEVDPLAIRRLCSAVLDTSSDLDVIIADFQESLPAKIAEESNPHSEAAEPDLSESPQQGRGASGSNSRLRPNSSRPNWHSEIRTAVEKLICNSDQRLLPIAQALALSCHPWRDEPTTGALISSMSAEMLPGRNINHPDALEIATDRLLRIAEALAFEGAHELAAGFKKAASEIDTHIGSQSRSQAMSHTFNTLVSNPHGISNPGDAKTGEGSVVEIVAGGVARDPTANVRDMILNLYTAVVNSGTDDVGCILTGEPNGVSVSGLAIELGIRLPWSAIDEYIDSLDSRERDVFVSRAFTLGKPEESLEDVGKRWGCSRERVRQIQKDLVRSARIRFEDSVIEFCNAVAQKFATRFVRVEALHDMALMLTIGSKYHPQSAAAILELLGPWSVKDGWAFHPCIASRVDGLIGELEQATSDYGIIDHVVIEQCFDGLFECESDKLEYMQDVLKLGQTGGVWTIKNTLKFRLPAALMALGRPSTKDELSQLVEHPAYLLANVLTSLDGIVRADMHRWGFNEWVEDSYDGIVGEIDQRIEDYGGVAPTNIIYKELTTLFGVSEGSIKAYLSSEAFVVKDGLVRRAISGDFCPKSPRSVKGAVRIGERWGQKIILEQSIFDGYSLRVSFDIAFANGIKPGDSGIVDVQDTNSQASVIFRTHNLNRTIDVGRASEALTALGFAVGDEIVVIPTPECVRFLNAAEVVASGEADEDRDLSQREARTDKGLKADINDPLLNILNTDSDG